MGAAGWTARTLVTTMLRPLWFESPSGIRMYAGAENDSGGWVVRLFDQNGKQISPIVLRVSYEVAADAIMSPLHLDVVTDLMHEMRRQVMAREMIFLTEPIK
jgi:hypothetical protein